MGNGGTGFNGEPSAFCFAFALVSGDLSLLCSVLCSDFLAAISFLFDSFACSCAALASFSAFSFAAIAALAALAAALAALASALAAALAAAACRTDSYALCWAVCCIC